MAAGNGKKKSKVTFTRSTGLNVNGSTIEDKVAAAWNPGKAKFKKRTGKGHNKFKTWQNK